MQTNSKSCVICGGIRGLPSRVCDSVICQAKYRDHLRQGGRVCVVCGRPVNQPQISVVVTCNSVECQRQAIGHFARKLPSCPTCGIQLKLANQITGSCDEPYCREQATGRCAAKLARDLLEKRESLEALAVAIYRRTQPSGSTKEPDRAAPIPIVVPANRRQLTSPPPERVAILRENLFQLAHAVVAEAGTPETNAYNSLAATSDRESSDALEAEQAGTNYDTLAGRACGTCLGFCCFAGREHAFLKHSDLRRTMHDARQTV